VAEEGLVSNIDLAPTLLDAAGAPIPASIQGRSLVPRLRGMSGLERDAVFAEKTFHNEYDPLRCVRTTRYKLIARFEASNPVEVPADIMRGRTYGAMMDQVLGPRGQPFELYDLSQDRWERDNRVDEPEYRSTASELRRRLRAWMEETEDPLLLGPVPSPYYHRTLAQLRT
jgi:arylsulfatase A-like enzyme